MSLATSEMSAADLAAIIGNRNDGGAFGGDGLSTILTIIILMSVFGGGWGFGGFGGFGGMGGAMMGAGMMGGFDGFGLYPWLNNSQNINNGFRDQMLQNSVNGIQNAVTSGFGDVQLGIAGVNQGIASAAAAIQASLCSGFAGVNQTINGAQNAITAQLYNNEIADLNRSFAEQTANAQGFNAVQAQLAQCCCDNRLATADTKYTIATEACATRTANASNTRDIIDSQNRGTQAILDKLCALELDGVKGQLAQAQRENVALQNQVNMATMQASQTAQTAQILAGQAAEIDGVYNRLKSCPVNTVPVFGNQPIFTCSSNVAGSNFGCGCGA